MRRSLATTVLVSGLLVAGCGGDDDSTTAEPARRTPTPSSVSGLPPEFIACMADQGYAIESADDVHAAPQEVLQNCFGAVHDGRAP
jgi:hypothetical protein